MTLLILQMNVAAGRGINMEMQTRPKSNWHPMVLDDGDPHVVPQQRPLTTLLAMMLVRESLNQIGENDHE